MASCSGSRIVHLDGTTAGCTNDDDTDGCAGRDLGHEGTPKRCYEWFGSCEYCGIIDIR